MLNKIKFVRSTRCQRLNLVQSLFRRVKGVAMLVLVNTL